jgi:hypothetical protein
MIRGRRSPSATVIHRTVLDDYGSPVVHDIRTLLNSSTSGPRTAFREPTLRTEPQGVRLSIDLLLSGLPDDVVQLVGRNAAELHHVTVEG